MINISKNLVKIFLITCAINRVESMECDPGQCQESFDDAVLVKMRNDLKESGEILAQIQKNNQEAQDEYNKGCALVKKIQLEIEEFKNANKEDREKFIKRIIQLIKAGKFQMSAMNNFDPNSTARNLIKYDKELIDEINKQLEEHNKIDQKQQVQQQGNGVAGQKQQPQKQQRNNGVAENLRTVLVVGGGGALAVGGGLVVAEKAAKVAALAKAAAAAAGNAAGSELIAIGASMGLTAGATLLLAGLIATTAMYGIYKVVF